MVETLVDKPLPWLSGEGEESAFVLFCSGALARNFADLPFPHRCSDEELRTAQDRILSALQSDDPSLRGQYCALGDLDSRELAFLQDRDFISHAFAQQSGPRGVFVSDNQCLSIMVNETDHLCLSVHAAALDFDQVWSRLDAADNSLSTGLDYAFDEKLGYLSGALGTVGTGLTLRAVIHLPALTMSSEIPALEQELRESRHCLKRIDAGDGKNSPRDGDLYEIQNTSTLGRSEEEIIYHINHAIQDIVAREKAARDRLTTDGHRGVPDRVGRAWGIARGACLLENDEASDLLSSLRLGVAGGLLEGVTLRQLNEIYMMARSGHLEMKLGQAANEMTLSIERADLFRAQFSGAT